MMTLRSEILLVLLLAAYLATELVAPIAVQVVCAALFPVRLGFAVTISRSSPQSDEEGLRPFPFLEALAPRAPPVS